MKKFFAALILATLALCPVFAQDDDDEKSEIKLTPPPISCLDFFKGAGQFTLTGLYLQVDMPEEMGTDEPIRGYGANIDIAKGTWDGFGSIVNFSYLLLNIPIEDPTSGDTEKMNAHSFGGGVTFVLDLLRGEKKDIAGEIIQKKMTLALFGGGSLLGSYYKIPDFFDSGYESTALMLDYGLSGGAAADIPLAFFFSLVPFYRYAAGSVTMKMEAESEYGSSEYNYDYKYTRTDWGVDIDLRPFRNAPEWKISMGTVLSQIKGMSEGMLMINFSIKHETGKHYSGTTFGPRLH